MDKKPKDPKKETKTDNPEEIPVYTLKELLALKVETEWCAWEGCEETAKKICSLWLPNGERCKRLTYCAEHYWRHVDQKHPAVSRITGGEDRKDQQ